MNQTQNAQRLKKHHEKLKVVPMESYSIEGEMYVTSGFLQSMYGVTVRQITNWKAKGLKESNMSAKSLKLFELRYVTKWHSENIDKANSASNDKSKSKKKESGSTEDFENLSTNVDDITDWNKIDLLKKKEELKLAIRKNEVEDGKYIPIEDSDIAMAEQAGAIISLFGNLRDILPTDTENMGRKDIEEVLDFHFKSTIDTLRSIVDGTVKENVEESIYSILLMAIKKGEEGINAKDIIKAIQEVEKYDGRKED